ncbi:MAG: HAD superfamily hydrolase (TIGR01509 family) [Polaribacter sp.]
MKQYFEKINLSWSKIDTVLLDMDGTLLDLHFDNYYWHDLLPQLYAKNNNISLSEGKKNLIALQEKVKGTLDWYCLDYWTKTLKIDIKALKHEILHKISFRPNAVNFLGHLKKIQNERRANKQPDFKIIMATNAHPDTIGIKMMKAEMNQYFDHICSSHELGYAKEEQIFWKLLIEKYQLSSSKCLFIDDSMPVLISASQFGIGSILAIDKPDSEKERKDMTPFTTVSDFSQLI